MRRPLGRLFPAHVPTSLAQKTVLGATSAVLSFVDPTRAEHVARLGDVTSAHALERLRARMRASGTGRRVLAERPSLKRGTSLATLATLAPGSFGRATADFMASQKLHLESRADVRFVDDDELAYVLQRYREVHDLWHVLFGVTHVTVAHEVGLKWVEALHTGLPVAVLAAVVGPLRLSLAEQRHLWMRVLPWALRNARSNVDLMAVYYEHHFSEPLTAVQSALRIEPFH